MVKKPQNAQNSGLPANLSQPAQRVLMGAGLQTLEQVAALGENEIKLLHGIGPKAIDQLRRALAEKDLTFANRK